jgi:hypothetical protein
MAKPESPYERIINSLPPDNEISRGIARRLRFLGFFERHPVAKSLIIGGPNNLPQVQSSTNVWLSDRAILEGLKAAGEYIEPSDACQSGETSVPYPEEGPIAKVIPLRYNIETEK